MNNLREVSIAEKAIIKYAMRKLSTFSVFTFVKYRILVYFDRKLLILSIEIILSYTHAHILSFSQNSAVGKESKKATTNCFFDFICEFNTSVWR